MDPVHTTCLVHAAVVCCCMLLLHIVVACSLPIVVCAAACLPWCVLQLASSGVCTECIEFMEPNGSSVWSLRLIGPQATSHWA